MPSPRSSPRPCPWRRSTTRATSGLFGVEDTRPSPADTEKTRDALEKFGKKYEFHTYDGAGHAFFAVDRPNYRQAAAAIDGWKKVFDFHGRYLR